MGCDKFRKQLSAYSDDALPEKESRQVEAHLERCEACREAWQEVQALQEEVAALPPVTAPEGFKASVMQEIHDKGSDGLLVMKPRRLSRSLIMSLAASFIIVAISVFLIYTSQQQSETVDLPPPASEWDAAARTADKRAQKEKFAPGPEQERLKKGPKKGPSEGGMGGKGRGVMDVAKLEKESEPAARDAVVPAAEEIAEITTLKETDFDVARGESSRETPVVTIADARTPEKDGDVFVRLEGSAEPSIQPSTGLTAGEKTSSFPDTEKLLAQSISRSRAYGAGAGDLVLLVGSMDGPFPEALSRQAHLHGSAKLSGLEPMLARTILNQVGPAIDTDEDRISARARKSEALERTKAQDETEEEAPSAAVEDRLQSLGYLRGKREDQESEGWEYLCFDMNQITLFDLVTELGTERTVSLWSGFLESEAGWEMSSHAADDEGDRAAGPEPAYLVELFPLSVTPGPGTASRRTPSDPRSEPYEAEKKDLEVQPAASGVYKAGEEAFGDSTASATPVKFTFQMSPPYPSRDKKKQSDQPPQEEAVQPERPRIILILPKGLLNKEGK
ncbi:MAG: anti-sigma factor family protein [Planctomycetota bacterium]|jgi:hypothetical protein